MSKPTQELKSIEDKLKAMRSGYKFAPELKYGEYTIQVRILTADEEAKCYVDARVALTKIPSITDEEREGLRPAENMKHLLMLAATIGPDQNLPRQLLNHLTSAELQALYEKYLDICCEVDPEFTTLSPNEINEIIMDVKKSPDVSKELSTRQLKGIGLYFLDHLLPLASKLGG